MPGMAEDLLDQILAQLRERKQATQAAYEESRQLERALAALDDDPQRTTRPVTGGRPARRPGRASKRDRAPRGANREAILSLVRERPGATAREIAQATGIARTTVASTVTRLAAEGALERSEQPGDGVGFRVPADGA